MTAIKQKTGTTIDYTDVQVLSALVHLYTLQEEDEKDGEYTDHKNGKGFSAFDSELLSSIAKQYLKYGKVSEKQLYVVRNRLAKYVAQISNMNLENGSDKGLVTKDNKIFELGHVKQPITKRTAVVKDNVVVLSFPYDIALIFKVKGITGRRYNATDKTWTIPCSIESTQFVQENDFMVKGDLPTMKKSVSKRKALPKMTKELRQYQKIGIEKMAYDMDMKALLADEPGLGKTCQSICACIARKDIAFPVLVVCPNSLKYNWRIECNMWMPGCTTRILSGTKPNKFTPQKNEFTIVNYDIIAGRVTKSASGKAAAKDGKKTKAKFSKQDDAWANTLAELGYKTIILDECQRVKNMTIRRTKAVVRLREVIPNILCLSGTPAENRPIELYSAISLINKSLFPNYLKFAKRYCGAAHNGFGWTYNGSSNMTELHEILTSTIMIRRKKSDVLTELPEKQRIVLPVETDMREYNATVSRALSYMQELKGMKPAQRLQAGAEALVHMEKCKQAAALAKMPNVLEWIEDYLDSDKKLVVFATHSFILDMIENKWKECSVRVDGSTPIKKRQENVETFQTNDNVKLFIGNTKAAGTGLTLTAASDTLTLEYGWTPGEHDQAEDRVHRIGQISDSVNAYYIVSCGTIEEDLIELLDNKRNVLSQVMDGIECADEEALVWQLYRRLEERA